MSILGTIKFAGVEYDIDDFTLDEMEEVENLVRRPMRSPDGGVIQLRDDSIATEPTPFGQLNYSSTPALKALVFVIMRKSNPNLTLEEVGKLPVASFVPADEEMPALPPEQGDEESRNGSEHEGSGAPPSVVSIAG